MTEYRLREEFIFIARHRYIAAESRSARVAVASEDVDDRDGEDNPIIDLQSGAERVFSDRDGAAGALTSGADTRRRGRVRRSAARVGGAPAEPSQHGRDRRHTT